MFLFKNSCFNLHVCKIQAKYSSLWKGFKVVKVAYPTLKHAQSQNRLTTEQIHENSHTSAIMVVLKLLNDCFMIVLTKTKPFGEKSSYLARKAISCLALKVPGILCPHSIGAGKDWFK